MKDVKLCCDCLKPVHPDEETVVLRSELSESEKSRLDLMFDHDGLIEVYICQQCYEERFCKNR